MQADFKQINCLITDVDISQWNSEGLPKDELSLQNGTITLKGQKYPLCIDPQLQAINWIKKRERSDLKITSFSDEQNFARTLEQCIKFGKHLLIENVGTYLDPLLDPILKKNVIIKGGRKLITLGGEQIEFNEKDFKLYMTTKLPNPVYNPQITGDTIIVNYTVTFSGLKEQLLNQVVGYENPEKEKLRKQLVL